MYFSAEDAAPQPMPRVTQECDFTIHEDEHSFCSSVEDEVESREAHGARESLDAREDDPYVEEPAESDADHADGADDSLAYSQASDEQENKENSYLEEEPPADTSTHETSQLDDSMAHSHDDGWEDEEGSYLEQEELESNAETHENGDHLGDADHSISYSQADDDSYAAAPAESSKDHTDGEKAQPASKRGSPDSSNSHRRTSGRTDALIQAAAKAVVTHMEKRNGTPKPPEDEPDFSILSHSTADADQSHGNPAREGEDKSSPRDSGLTPVQEDAGGDSSSHNGGDDDVFSDRSPRSSLGSAPSDPERKQSILSSAPTFSPRISNISQYEGDDAFVPTSRSTPRPPFRSPSSVKAMQMASPPTSVYGSPRSGRRGYNGSRLGGSSMSSAQFSPRGRSTPTRLKAPREAPLVLLHVTLLPLAWPWGDVLEGAEGLSEGARGLRDAWRQLQSRMGNTVLERGVLLPHPQNDYEVLEERVLESLELPLKRRARILECGHYLGPSNVASVEDSDSEAEEYEGRFSTSKETRHWCGTCKHDIKYETLGEGRVYRVKVYASNGLMKAGAWGACWKEMERVDVEIEPWVEAEVQGELNRLAAEEERREEEIYMEQQMGYEAEEDMYAERETGNGVKDEWVEESGARGSGSMMVDRRHNIPSSPTRSPTPARRSEDQSRSLLSPAQRMLASQGQDPQKSTTMINRSSAHVVPTTPNREMQLEQRSHSTASHRHRESRMLGSSSDALDDERALPGGPQRRLLQSTPNTETQLERSHSSVSHRNTTPHREVPRPSRTRMAIEDRSPPREVSSPASEPPFTPDQRDPPHPDTDRRRRDEERLREIYGHTPPSHSAASPSPRHEDSYMREASPRHEESYMPEASPRGRKEEYIPETLPPRREEEYIPEASPPSPSQQAFERREERREAYREASLVELLVQAARVFISDRKNIAIMVLTVLVVGLAVGGGSGQRGFNLPDFTKRDPPSVEVSYAGTPGVENVGEVEMGTQQEQYRSEGEEALRLAETQVEREVVRLVETVTETVKFTSTEPEVEAGTASEADAEAHSESPSSESASAGAAEAETLDESAQPEPDADVPEASVGSEDEAAVEDAPQESAANVEADDAEHGSDELLEPAAEPPAHEEL